MNEVDVLKKILRDNGPKGLGNVFLTRTVNDAALSLEVSPCSWMHVNYGLQVKITMDGGGVCYLINKSVRFADATIEDLNALFDKVKVVKCSRCGKPAFDQTAMDTNRGGLCESCFISDLDEQFKKEVEKEDAKVANLDAKYKKKGCKFRVTAWIHAAGGDTAIEIWYAEKPSTAKVQADLRKKGSRVLNDFAVIEL